MKSEIIGKMYRVLFCQEASSNWWRKQPSLLEAQEVRHEKSRAL